MRVCGAFESGKFLGSLVSLADHADHGSRMSRKCSGEFGGSPYEYGMVYLVLKTRRDKISR